MTSVTRLHEVSDPLPSPASAVASLTRDLETTLDLQAAVRGQYVVKPQVVHFVNIFFGDGPFFFKLNCILKLPFFQDDLRTRADSKPHPDQTVGLSPLDESTDEGTYYFTKKYPVDFDDKLKIRDVRYDIMTRYMMKSTTLSTFII